MKHTFSIICILLLCTTLSAQNNLNNEIANTLLKLQYNEANQSLTLSTISQDKAIVSTQIADAKPKFKQVHDSKWGTGNQLVFKHKDGSISQFTLYTGSDFLFASHIPVNNSSDTLDLRKSDSFRWVLNWGKPASELKTLGTGGLMSPDKNPGSYLFLTTVDPTTRNGVVTGWLSVEKGSGVLFPSVDQNNCVVSARMEYGHYLIPPGKFANPETMLIGYFDDARIGEEKYADALSKEYSIKLKPRMATYCTWYAEKNGGAGNEKSTKELADFISQNLKQYGLKVIQIDDKWQAGGQYNGPHRGFDCTDPKGPYPNGLTSTAEYVKSKGLITGLWWMPFARNHQAPEYKDKQSWFAYRNNGKPYETPWGGTSLDLTVPQVQEQIKTFSQNMMHWGIEYFKMDGLWTGTVTEQVYINDGYKNDSIGNNRLLHNPMVTQIEAYRNGLKLINQVTQGKVYLSGCNVSQNMRSLGASIGLVHSMRIGPDYSHEDGIKTGPLRASRLYFLNGRVWWNDPDPAVIRESGRSDADGSSKGVGDLARARMLPSFAAITGDFYLSSDWIPDLPAERLEIMKRTMLSHNAVVRPIDAFDKLIPEMWLVSDKRKASSRYLIGMFNWDKTEKRIGCTTQWAGLNPGKTYYAYDFWGNKILPEITDSISLTIPAQTMHAIALREKTSHPVVVSTSQHITQGMTDIVSEQWTGKSLRVTSKLIPGDTYEVRIAGVNDGKNRNFAGVTVVSKKSDATIQMLPSETTGWMKIKINSKRGGHITWQCSFK